MKSYTIKIMTCTHFSYGVSSCKVMPVALRLVQGQSNAFQVDLKTEVRYKVRHPCEHLNIVCTVNSASSYWS